MKSIQKITRIPLKISQTDEFILLGLVSSEPDYKLSLSLNNKFRISLKNISAVKVIDAKGKELSFSRFSDSSGLPGTVYNLFSNRTGNHFLLKNLKNVDFIFQVHVPENENNIGRFTDGLREIDVVNAVFNIDLNTFRDKNLEYLIQ